MRAPLTAAYRALAGAHDEMVDPSGDLRAGWGTLVESVDRLGADGLASQWAVARKLIRDNGISHNIYGDPEGLDRPWSLDAIPLLIPATEWKQTCVALSQRARLMDRLLADLYGPADVVFEKLLPPELLWDNPGFLRACHGLRPPGEKWIHIYGADLVRMPDRAFHVLSDRTQNPSGAGYSLENRVVISRALPAMYRLSNAQRLAPFFIALRQTLATLAPETRRENPRVVLLTPGPYNETYFEHAYLARYLGYQLVQGNDLTVRDAIVYLKTLSGLQRIDVILRRVDDSFCDPLELYHDSYLGVPGLLQAARSGNVAIANALGSGVLQAPGLLPFLPGICKRLLGEELRMPSVRTWWCGDANSRAYVLDHLDGLVIKSAYPTRGEDPVFASELSRDDRSALAERIRQRPERYVAQERVMDTTTPTLAAGTLEPRRFVIRAYLCASGEDYVAMAGGLTRVAGSDDARTVSLQRGAGSKDTWILDDGPVLPVTLLPSGSTPVAINRGAGDLPSRVADDLFWLGRYVERAEAMVRLARGATMRLLDHDEQAGERVAMRLLRGLLPSSRSLWPETVEDDLVAELFAPLPSSLVSVVSNLHRLAGLLRDQISLDAWRVLQSIVQVVMSFSREPGGAMELYDAIISRCSAFAGLTGDSMSRGYAWTFVDLGRRLERAVTTARLLRDTLGAPADTPAEHAMLLETLLELADSSMVYRRRYLTHLETHAVVDLLLADETSPRSVVFQLAEMERHLRELPKRNSDVQLLQRLQVNVTRADMFGVCAVTGNARSQLEALLSEIANSCAQLSQTIAQRYFAHSALPRELGDQPPGAE